MYVKNLTFRSGHALLLSVLFAASAYAADVRSFGAIGNGIADDTAAIQNAINSCSSGGTLTFSTGSYSVRGLALKSNCTYQGSGHTTLTLTNPNGFILDISQQSGIHITGLALDGNNLGGAIIAQLYGPAQNIQVDNCSFLNVSSNAAFPANLAFMSSWGMVNATIQNNKFENVASGIWFTTVENVTIQNNSFINVTQGDAIYIAPNPAGFQNGDNLKIIGNTGTNMARIAIELFQPDPRIGAILNAPLVQNNSFSNWTGNGGMGMSIAIGDKATVSGNHFTNMTGPVQDTGIEVIVSNAQFTGNDITGNFAEGISVVGTPNNTITSNHIANVTDNGIVLACDVARARCSSTGTTIIGNSIVNAQLIGIKLDNDWSNSLIARNTISRTAGSWPNDATNWFIGVHQSPAPGPGVIDSNDIIQDATTWPYGFWFGGVRLNSPMPGSSVTNNMVRSLTTVPFGSVILDNTGSATVGWIISGNHNINLFHDIN